MLLDISPLCLYHNEPMILTQKTLHPRRFLEENCHWFACPVHDCNQIESDTRFWNDATQRKQPVPSSMMHDIVALLRFPFVSHLK